MSRRTIFKPTYYAIDDVEQLERYRPGGNHPITLQESLNNGRYRIVHKLGHGTFSTVWRAQDQAASASYVAVKVGTADCEGPHRELLQRLEQSGADGDGEDDAALFNAVLDDFTLQGPNGTHRCLVTRPARSSLANAKELSMKGLLRLPVARAIAVQLIKAEAFTHFRGVVHAGQFAGTLLTASFTARFSC